MPDEKIIGGCFCGAVKLEVKGKPTAMFIAVLFSTDTLSSG
ncbi:uncharacterized protein METZ01_LOCUS373636 [marine metagenome]|jgi:hypothetical protein|uniref:Uncharacterized protein n=1 Tax=marine metagenome TaxID=408172 RepID=A0A382TG75_9ZZZZ